MKSLIKLLVLILCFFIAGPVFAASSTDTFAKFPEGYHGVNLGDKWMDVKHVLTASNTLFKRGHRPAYDHCSYQLRYKDRGSPSKVVITYTFFQDKVCHILYQLEIDGKVEEGMKACLEKYGEASEVDDKRPIYQRILIVYNTPSSLNGKVAKAVIYLALRYGYYGNCVVCLSVHHADFARLHEQRKICDNEARKKENKRIREEAKKKKKNALP